MTRTAKQRRPYETADYAERWLFGDEARTWLREHPVGISNERGFRRHFRLEHAVDDGWGIVVSGRKNRPDDESSRRVVCPKCKHELQVNQHAWMYRHERKCNLPTRTSIAGWLADAFNVFTVRPEMNTADHHIRARAIVRAFRTLTKETR